MTGRELEPFPLRPSPPAAGTTIGLALGGGGARGLAHIAMLEAFDEPGVRPKVIAGTSIGAIFGAAYASGISGRELREHTRYILSQRFGLLRDLFAATQPFQRILSVVGARTAILDPQSVLELILPRHMKDDFATCEIPLKIVASDFYDQEPKVFTEGSLRLAVAASMALPVLFQPVVAGNRALIDGGMTNPLPFDLLMSEADVVVAIDVSGAPVPDPRRATPTVFEALFASAFLFERTIVKEKLKAAKPDILIDAGTSRYQVLDFLKFDEILAAAEPAKERLKQQLARVLSVETLPQLQPVEQPRLPPQNPPKPKRGLLARTRKTRKPE
jgi:NTE family protein